MSFVNHIIDFIASEDVIDLYFILSDLFDIDLTDDEIYETAELDAYAVDDESFFKRLARAGWNMTKGTVKLGGMTGRFVYGIFRQTRPRDLGNGTQSVPSHLIHLEYMDFDKYEYKD